MSPADTTHLFTEERHSLSPPLIHSHEIICLRYEDCLSSSLFLPVPLQGTQVAIQAEKVFGIVFLSCFWVVSLSWCNYQNLVGSTILSNRGFLQRLITDPDPFIFSLRLGSIHGFSFSIHLFHFRALFIFFLLRYRGLEFLSFFWPLLIMWKFSDQGSNPCYSRDPSHFSDNARYSIH